MVRCDGTCRDAIAVLNTLHDQTVHVLVDEDFRSKFLELGLEPIGNSAQEFTALIRSEIPRWARIIKTSDAKPD